MSPTLPCVAGVGVDGVADEVNVQVPVAIVVEPVGLGVETGEIKSVVSRSLNESSAFLLKK